MKVFANDIRSTSGISRRTATMVVAALVSSLAGVPGSGRPGFITRAWAQTAAPPSAPLGGISKPDTSQTPTPDVLEAAKRHFDRGVDFFEHGNYAAARTEFETAYALSRYPQLLFNLGKTAEKLNQTADAIHFYEGYLLSDLGATDAAEVHARLDELYKRPATPPPSAAPASSTPSPPSPTSSTPLAQRLPPIPAMALMGAGVGLLIIGIGCGAGALSDANYVTRSGTAMPRVPYDMVADAVSQGRTLDGVGITFDVLGSLALVAGGAWTGYWLYQRSKAKNQPAAAVSSLPIRLGAGLAGSL